MPTPTWVTNENIKFDGTLTPAVVLSDNAGVKKMIIWDNLSLSKQNLLEEIINDYGGTTPLTSPTAGFQKANIGSDKIGTDTTNLENTDDAPGYAIINIGGDKVGTDQSGLVSSLGSSGSQTINYNPDILGSDPTGLADDVPATPGSQEVDLGGTAIATTPTGLANDATVYTATVTIDGSIVENIAVTGSLAQDVASLITEINLDLNDSSASLVNGNIVITSFSTGSTSSVSISDTDLFSSLTPFVSINATTTGTDVVVTNYDTTITIDGNAFPVTIPGNAAQTFDDLVTALGSFINGAGTVSLLGGNIVVSSDSVGPSSTVVVTEGTLFPATTNYQSILAATAGTGEGTVYRAVLEIDSGNFVNLNITSGASVTFDDIITEINNDLSGWATAALDNGNIKITSLTNGSSSKVKVFDTNRFFGAMNGFVDISSTPGTDKKVYEAIVEVDGVDVPLSIAGLNAQTFDDLITEMNTDLGASAVAALVNGDLVITSATTGVGSTVKIKDKGMFKALNGFFNFADPKEGATDLMDVFIANRAPNGSLLTDCFSIIDVASKPPVPFGVQHSIEFIYYDGTGWLYLDDDTPV